MLSQKLGLTLILAAALPAWAAYDANGIALGASEKDVTRQFPGVYCKPLQWNSTAADRRCDDPKATFGGANARITFYLKQGKVQAFDVRFGTEHVEQVAAFLKSRYGKPSVETRQKNEATAAGDKAREVYKLRWDEGEQHAVLTATMQKRRASLTVSRGDFEEEIYRIR